jgi:small-conductance mechanosensitive channel
LEKQNLADLPKAIEEQRSKLKALTKHLPAQTKAMKLVPGSDAEDAKIIDEVNHIRLHAISTIQNFLG